MIKPFRQPMTNKKVMLSIYQQVLKLPLTILNALQYNQMPKTIQQLTDPELLARAGHGNEEAMAALYDRHAGKIFGMAMRFVHQPDQAEDVVQEVFADAWRAADRYRPEIASVSTWLGTITHNRAISRLRKERRRREVGDNELFLEMQVDEKAKMPEPDDPLLIEALKQLPADQRKVIVLAYYGGYTQSQIAKKLSMPLGTVKTKTHNALKQLRKSLPEKNND